MKNTTICFLVLLSLTLTGPRPAQAKKCISHAYEIMELDLQQVSQAGKRVPTPAFFADKARIQNSGAMGKVIHLRDTPAGQLAQFYQQKQTVKPAKQVVPWLRKAARRRVKTACDTKIPITPILPGRYTFQSGDGGAKQPKLFSDPLLTVHRTRQEVSLSFTIKKLTYVARYRVACRLFPAEAHKYTCRTAKP
jgi:hypothetical protein